MKQHDAVLLDTCVLIWLMNGDLSRAGEEALVHAGLAKGMLVSPVSGWEIGLLANPRRGDPRLTFRPDPARWLATALAKPGIRQIELTPTAALAASYLPEPLHHDPADRLLIATAREMGVPLMTSDRRILDYAAAGHVEAIAC